MSEAGKSEEFFFDTNCNTAHYATFPLHGTDFLSADKQVRICLKHRRKKGEGCVHFQSKDFKKTTHRSLEESHKLLAYYVQGT